VSGILALSAHNSYEHNCGSAIGAPAGACNEQGVQGPAPSTLPQPTGAVAATGAFSCVLHVTALACVCGSSLSGRAMAAASCPAIPRVSQMPTLRTTGRSGRRNPRRRPPRR
jgi:hypothetical protein